MIESHPQHATLLWVAGRPATKFCMLAVGLLVAVALSSEALFGSFFVATLLFALIAALCLRGLLQSYPHDMLGACNIVTLGRAALVCVLAGAIFFPASEWSDVLGPASSWTASQWTVFGIASLAFALDGADGWLARRAGLSSAFGARFDMEVDALLGAVLALILLREGTAGPAILVLGFSRYVFVLASLKWRALQGALPESFRRKAICVVQIAALIILIFPLTPPAVILPLSLIAAAALLYSFGADAVYLLRKTK